MGKHSLTKIIVDSMGIQNVKILRIFNPLMIQDELVRHDLGMGLVYRELGRRISPRNDGIIKKLYNITSNELK